jgi:hypothetical protein
VNTLSISGGQRAMSSKSHRPDTRSSDRPRCLDFSRTLVTLSVAASPAASRARVHGDKAQSIAFWHVWLAQEVLFLDRGDAPRDRRQHRHTAIRSDEIVVARGILQAAPSGSTTSPAEDSQEGSPSPCRRYHDELAVTTFLGTPTLLHLTSSAQDGRSPCCQIAAKNDQDPFVIQRKGLWLGIL